LFKERLMGILGNQPTPVGAGSQRPAQKPGSGASQPVADAHRRQSPGLDQFIACMREDDGLSILDLAGASQANVSFITNMGHRLYSDDIVHALDTAFGADGSFFENQTDAARVNAFISQTLDFPEANFGGALVWDTLQFLTAPLLQQTVDQLHHVMKPGASLLAFFHSDEKQKSIPVYSYRIEDPKTVLLVPKGRRREAQCVNNRNIEKMFSKFSSVKFFLTRDHLREVLVRR